MAAGAAHMNESGRPVVAITGAGGLVGASVIQALGESAFDVRRLSRGAPASNDRLARLPPFDAPDRTFEEALAGATHVVHAAGLTNADRRTSEADFLNANARLTEKLARAAQRVTPGRFLFISSIRAVAGQGFGGVIDASTEPAPGCAYGRSKRQGELAAAEAFSAAPHRLTILRPAPVYGRGMKGNLARLLRLAETPYPLPFGGLANRRSLQDAGALARAVVHVLAAPKAVDGAYIVSDREPVTIAEIIAAFRTGMGRPARLFHVPTALLGRAAMLAGHREALRGMFAGEICDPSALEATGWLATRSSIGGLKALARPLQDGARH
jgi:UDP-glucose 4-epimerase